jgi:hypothetical protein
MKMPKADQQKVDAVEAAAEMVGVEKQIHVNIYSETAIQVEWCDEGGSLIYRDYTFASDFVENFKRALKR